jgi:hypothetical protein
VLEHEYSELEAHDGYIEAGNAPGQGGSIRSNDSAVKSENWRAL